MKSKLNLAKHPQPKLNQIIFVIVVGLLSFNILIFTLIGKNSKISDSEENTTIQSPVVTPSEQTDDIETTIKQQIEHTVVTTEQTANTITKGSEYAYMTDDWSIYIATAISDNIIKIEGWEKVMSNSKSLSYEYDVGYFKINDSENCFKWLDNEKNVFTITFTDKRNSEFKKGGNATFTINISSSDVNKGSNYSEKIACYTYNNDDWHIYKAIPLNDTLIKVETWTRGSSLGKFLFGYDLCIIDTTSNKTDFEWVNEEHTAFSITMKDTKNKSNWKKEKFVVFELENDDYKYSDVNSYLNK